MSDFKNCEDELNFVTQDRELAYIELDKISEKYKTTRLNLAGAEHDLRQSRKEITQLKASNKALSNGLISAAADINDYSDPTEPFDSKVQAAKYRAIVNEHGG